MDWSRAKNIFIIAFLLLNISLGYQLYLKHNENVQSKQWTSNNIDDLKDTLKQQNIKLNLTVPKEMPEMHFLQIKNKLLTSYNNVDQSIEESVHTDKNALESRLLDMVYHFDQYEYSPIESNGEKKFIYYQVNEKFSFFGAKLEVDLNKNTIAVKQNYFEIINKGLDRQVISSYSALRTVLDQQLIPKDAEIVEIKLGYHGQNNQVSTQLLTPVWRITYKTEKLINSVYVNAMTGGLQNIAGY